MGTILLPLFSNWWFLNFLKIAYFNFFCLLFVVEEKRSVYIKCELISGASPRHLNTFCHFFIYCWQYSTHISIHVMNCLLLTVPMYTMLSISIPYLVACTHTGSAQLPSKNWKHCT